MADVLELVLEKVEEDRLTDARIASYRRAISDFLLSQRGQSAADESRLRRRIKSVSEKISLAETRLLKTPDDMLPALYKQIRDLREQKQAAEAQLAAQARLGESSEEAIAADCRTYEKLLREIRRDIHSDESPDVRNALEKIVDKIEVFSRPVTRRTPGMSPRTKRVLAEVRIHYKEVLDVLQVAHRVDSVKCSFAGTGVITAPAANCNFANIGYGR
jgi:chromosome segregation ATPase